MTVGYTTDKNDLKGEVAQIQLLTQFAQDGGYAALQGIEISPADNLYGPLTQNGATGLGVTALGANEAEADYAAQMDALDNKVKAELALAQAVVQGLENGAANPANAAQLTAFFEGHDITVDDSNGFTQEIEAYKKQIGFGLEQDLSAKKGQNRERDEGLYRYVHNEMNTGVQGSINAMLTLFGLIPGPNEDPNKDLAQEAAAEMLFRIDSDEQKVEQVIDYMAEEGTLAFDSPEAQESFKAELRTFLDEEVSIGKNDYSKMREFFEKHIEILNINIPDTPDGLTYGNKVEAASVALGKANEEIIVKGPNGQPLFTLDDPDGAGFQVQSVHKQDSKIVFQNEYMFTAQGLANKIAEGFTIQRIESEGTNIGYRIDTKSGDQFVLEAGAMKDVSDAFKQQIAPAAAPEEPKVTPKPKVQATAEGPSSEAAQQGFDSKMFDNINFAQTPIVNDPTYKGPQYVDDKMTAPSMNPSTLPGAV